MTERVYSINEIATIIQELIVKYSASKAILFGSYARNEADKDSDVDVMIVGGNLFETTDIFSIAEDLHRAVQKPVDVYEESEIDHSSELYANIIREGVEIV